MIVVNNWSNIGKEKVDISRLSITFIFAEKKLENSYKGIVIKEDCSASGCNHTDFVTGNGKFWFPVALQCSFIFRNPL